MKTPMAVEATRLDVDWLREGELARLLALLDRDGEEARVVGGAVRNALLREPLGDIDIATTARPEEVARRVEAAGFKAVPTGVEHGTTTVVADGQPFEVTTLREDVETYGRHAKVVFGRDWRRDAERRDFTMNALFLSRDGTVHDYVGGRADIADRRVRFIGDAATRIAEDYLRILRFFRFHAAYGHGGLPDAEGLHACIVARAGLETLRLTVLQMGQAIAFSCPRQPLATPVQRLDAAGDRLNTLIYATMIISRTLNSFYESLTDEQKANFRTIGRSLGQRGKNPQAAEAETGPR